MELNAKLDLLLRKTNDNDEKLNRKVDAINNKLTEFSQKLTVIEGKVIKNEENIRSLQAEATKEAVSITNIGLKLAEHKEIIDANSLSCEFISSKYELLKNLPVEIAAIKSENVALKKTIDDVNNALEQEKKSRNREQQYHRTSLNIKLCGVPIQPGEEDTKSVSNMTTLEVIKHVCDAVNITLNSETIDVCHRLGSSNEERSSPIIVRFKTKRARFEFFSQKSKMKGFTTGDVDFTKFNVPNNGVISSIPPKQGLGDGFDLIPIYMQEHLTKQNKDLLKSAKRQLRGVYEFPGYVLHGEIRVKLNKESKYLVIECENDITKLLHG